MATPFQEPYSFPKNSALNALRGNDTARTGEADSREKSAPTPISAAEHQALATVAQERRMRKLQDAVIRMKASPIKTAFIEVTKQAAKLMRAPVKTVIDNLTNWQLRARSDIGDRHCSMAASAWTYGSNYLAYSYECAWPIN
jgi:hypothetical protein